MDPLSREAIRIYRRYQLEIVEALKLCPWAERARLDGRVKECVVLSEELDQEASLSQITDLSADERAEIGLVIFPRLTVSRTDFDWFVSRLVQADAARYEIGMAPFAMAAFHPEAKPDFGDAERLIPFLRRTPDPTIQLVRTSSLERVREGFNEGTQFMDLSALTTLDLARDESVPLRERIARTNLRTIERVGVSEVERRLAAIRTDRDAAYAAWEGSRASRADQP